VCGDEEEDKGMRSNVHVEAGKYQLVFFTPEAIITQRRYRRLLRSEVYKARIRALVIDEAHTITKWYVKIKHGTTCNRRFHFQFI
jgi:superfamily II DNA helicase RecQ